LQSLQGSTLIILSATTELGIENKHITNIYNM